MTLGLFKSKLLAKYPEFKYDLWKYFFSEIIAFNIRLNVENDKNIEWQRLRVHLFGIHWPPMRTKCTYVTKRPPKTSKAIKETSISQTIVANRVCSHNSGNQCWLGFNGLAISWLSVWPLFYWFWLSFAPKTSENYFNLKSLVFNQIPYITRAMNCFSSKSTENFNSNAWTQYSTIELNGVRYKYILIIFIWEEVNWKQHIIHWISTELSANVGLKIGNKHKEYSALMASNIFSGPSKIVFTCHTILRIDKRLFYIWSVVDKPLKLPSVALFSLIGKFWSDKLYRIKLPIQTRVRVKF